ncbi:MAG: hypothetical protein KUG72_00335 [Pseudomonadales bacterium]|nr:hypothetical protein [Pseudomonadales bacterium]
MPKLLSIIALSITILILLAQIDDDLSIEAVNLINQIEADRTSESYPYLIGIFAGENESPEDVGRKIINEYQQLEADASYEIIEYQNSKKIFLPKGDLFCWSFEDGCLESLFSSDVDIASLINQHTILLNRTNTFLDFEEYRTLAKPLINQPIPPYQYIIAAERIKVLSAISIYKNGYPEEAIDSLLTQLSKLRKSLELQDNLIGKLVFLRKLSEIIDVASVILSKEGLKVEKISGLSKTEKSFSMIAAREFGMSYYGFKSLDKNPEFFRVGGKVPGWIIRLLYKPNMTINAITPGYYRLEHLAQLAPTEFVAEIEKGNNAPLSTSKVRNGLGAALITISLDFLDKYIAMFNDFDAKIVLFNQMHQSGDELIKAKNPYYGDEAIEKPNGSVCFDGPMEDEMFLRCLRVKI